MNRLNPPPGFAWLVVACAVWACSRTLLDYDELDDRSRLAVRTRWMIWNALMAAGVPVAVVARELGTSQQMLHWARNYAKLSDYKSAQAFAAELKMSSSIR
jgi:hypothetical protein